MKLNYETAIVGKTCVLVPYRKEHVARYHEWMQDPDLLEATGSEPLTMQEEIDMQESWCKDPDKCTFIVLAKGRVDMGEDVVKVDTNLEAMAGDVNLFLSELESDEEESEEVTSLDSEGQQGELNIMIAEKQYRRNGMGKEACCLMMMYGAKMIGIRRFNCKIKEDNHASIALFLGMGFKQCGYAECFGEVELELRKETSEDMCKSLSRFVSSWTVKDCPI